MTDKSGNVLNEDFDIATNFNTFFASVFTHEDISYIPKVVDMIHQDTPKCSDVHFTEEDVLSALDKLRADKASGPDDLSPRLLVEIRNELCYPLFLLFRKTLDESTIPVDWKRANVCPIFKKGSRNSAENYRPVSLTSQICKVFESLVRDTLVRHLEQNCLIQDSQHGFRKGRSCLTNLLTFLDKVTGIRYLL